MSIQIHLNICRSCLAEESKTDLTELSADSDLLKSFQFLINSDLTQLPTTFCQKCISKIKIAAAFKKLSLESEKYLVNLIKKINQDLKNTLSSISSGNRQSIVEEKSSNDDEEEQELAFLMQEDEIQKEEQKDPEASTSATASEEQTTPKVLRSPKKSVEKLPKQEHQLKLEVVQEKNFITSDMYDEDQQMESDHIFSDDKEIYDIMEIEGNDDIYVDEAGNAILNGEDEDGEFILVNYKSENDDVSTEKEYIVEEEEDDELYDEQQQQVTKPARKKHVARMPREIVDRYAQSNESNQHICTKCVKVFSTRTNLIRHIQSHDGNKPYVCEICKKGFTQSGSLKQHMYIHSGERPYKCSYCDKAFTQGKTLKFHMRRHMNEKPFVCSECNCEFRQRDGLKRHLKSRHNIELKYERNSQGNEKIIAFVEMKETDGKTLEILEETSESTEEKKPMEF